MLNRVRPSYLNVYGLIISNVGSVHYKMNLISHILYNTEVCKLVEDSSIELKVTHADIIDHNLHSSAVYIVTQLCTSCGLHL